MGNNYGRGNNCVYESNNHEGVITGSVCVCEGGRVMTVGGKCVWVIFGGM